MQCHFNPSTTDHLTRDTLNNQQKLCFSCPWMSRDYTMQIADKQKLLSSAMVDLKPKFIAQPVVSAESAFRNKAKMAVLGTVEKPILGIKHGNVAVDLCDCPLYSKSMQTVLKMIRTYIRKQELVPYNIDKRKGELKFVVVTESDRGFMVRFILRSERLLDKIKNTFNAINIRDLIVFSVNIQPTHAAIMEGEKEIILTQNHFLPFTLNHVPLFIKPKSFFQTNTEIAAKLYQTASDWVADLDITTIWDLFCGVGGFGLHCMMVQLNREQLETKKSNIRQLVGIEISPEAIACATESAKLLGIREQVSFKSLDVADYSLIDDKFPDGQLKRGGSSTIPDLVLVNPPRRGVGEKLCAYLQQIKPRYILYSSCNLDTLVADIKQLPDYQIEKVQLFDMFPHTPHMEILALLTLN
ncbi:23S rRNA (uracil(747)-C(5))-methyltransferase RlmC [Orbaceae bacterium ESL0721]|nr:23S rRNA (uracil(747)-C(5))-methyltransferase RlmC [Orbaceae bacterium ESL0721]